MRIKCKELAAAWFQGAPNGQLNLGLLLYLKKFYIRTWWMELGYSLLMILLCGSGRWYLKLYWVWVPPSTCQESIWKHIQFNMESMWEIAFQTELKHFMIECKTLTLIMLESSISSDHWAWKGLEQLWLLFFPRRMRRAKCWRLYSTHSK